MSTKQKLPVATGNLTHLLFRMNHTKQPAEYQARYAPQLSPQELLSIFPEAKTEYILPRLRELTREIKTLETSARETLKRAKHIEDGWFIEEVVKAFVIAPMDEAIRRFDKLKRYLPLPPVPGRINQDRIERAREYPILEIAKLHLRDIKRSARTWKSICPYHEERTPSFHMYPDTNTFYCFGCQAHGDVISLTQMFVSTSFIEAVKYLTPSYVLQ